MAATTPQQQQRAALAVIAAIAETIRECGECPAGPMYATLMSRLNLQSFEKIIATLENADLVEKRGDILRWVGPHKGGY